MLKDTSVTATDDGVLPHIIYVSQDLAWVLEPDGKTYILINLKTDAKIATSPYDASNKKKRLKKRRFDE